MNHPTLPLAVAPRQRRRLRSNRRRLAGFSLVEAIIGAGLTVVVVTALGTMALLAELRLGREAEVNQSLRDTWGRALQFIASEAKNALWIRNSLPGGYPCGGTAPASPLVLEGPPDPANPSTPLWQVVYGVKANTSARDWRGANLLVRCGPTYRALPLGRSAADREAKALAGDFDLTAPVSESVLADQLAPVSPFQVVLYDITAGRDRSARLSLFLRRPAGGAIYPPAGAFSGHHTQLHVSRNPGFNTVGDPACTTELDEATGNQEPSSGCEPIKARDSLFRRNTLKEYNLPASGTFTVNSCGPGCDGPLSSDNTDVVYLKGTYAAFSTRQFDAEGQPNAEGPCSRVRCHLSNGTQTVTIHDGDVLVFYDRVVRL